MLILRINFPKITFVGVPEVGFLLLFYSEAINKTYELSIPGAFRQCVSGEIFNPINNKCEECPAGSFSFSPSDKSCTICPSNAVCAGGNQLKLSRGFWRSSFLSKEVLKCNKGQENCLGGDGYSDQSCRTGHKGPLCRNCDSTPSTL